MAKYKVGDKVRILDVDAILFGRAFWSDGVITEVLEVLEDEVLEDSVILYGLDGDREDGLRIYPSEMHAIEKVSDDEETYLELIERIEMLEVQVAENSRLLDEYLSKQSKSNPVNMYEWKDGRLRLLPESSYKTSNELRKEAIEKAKEFVDNVVARGSDGDTFNDDTGGNNTYQKNFYAVDFVVNEEKQTVVALVHLTDSYGKVMDKSVHKGIAKCNPDDVFNADIGKAIAIGRAFGLDTSDFELAPQPDEAEVGMRAEIRGNFGAPFEVRVTGTRGFHSNVDSLRTSGRLVRIISDTEAKY